MGLNRHIATYCSTLQHTATHYTALQHAATRCNTLVEEGMWGMPNGSQEMCTHEKRPIHMKRDYYTGRETITYGNRLIKHTYLASVVCQMGLEEMYTTKWI